MQSVETSLRTVAELQLPAVAAQHDPVRTQSCQFTDDLCQPLLLQGQCWRDLTVPLRRQTRQRDSHSRRWRSTRLRNSRSQPLRAGCELSSR